MVGAIIGKGGAKINEIRQLSGSVIKINEPQDNSNERLVTITGTSECNQMALYMLYSRLGKSFRKPRAEWKLIMQQRVKSIESRDPAGVAFTIVIEADCCRERCLECCSRERFLKWLAHRANPFTKCLLIRYNYYGPHAGAALGVCNVCRSIKDSGNGAALAKSRTEAALCRKLPLSSHFKVSKT